MVGIASATRGNDIGIAGVLHQPRSFCVVMARVFDSTQADGGARTSDILEAIEWVALQQAKVINLSLGTTSYSFTTNDLLERLHNDGV